MPSQPHLEAPLKPRPGFWSKLQFRWRIWRRDPALMEGIAREALRRCGVCDESDSYLRFAWDSQSGHLIVMVYLAHFDHAAWTLSRHIESYLMRQFKGLHGIPLHSVHLDVVRKRAFDETPVLKSAVALRAVLRERRHTGVRPSGLTGKKIARDTRTAEAADVFEPTGRMGLEGGHDNDSQPADEGQAMDRKQILEERKNRAIGKIRNAIGVEEYLSVPGYEISEVDFEEFLSSLPADSSLVHADASTAPSNPDDGNHRKPPRVHPALIPETDIMRRDAP